jgi:hypothetical protein
LDAKGFAGLKQSGLRRLTDAQNAANSLESRFDLAYNAAPPLSLAALRRAGYRSTNRYIVFQALPHTLGVAMPIERGDKRDSCTCMMNPPPGTGPATGR